MWWIMPDRLTHADDDSERTAWSWKKSIWFWFYRCNQVYSGSVFNEITDLIFGIFYDRNHRFDISYRNEINQKGVYSCLLSTVFHGQMINCELMTNCLKCPPWSNNWLWIDYKFFVVSTNNCPPLSTCSRSLHQRVVSQFHRFRFGFGISRVNENVSFCNCFCF